MIGLVLRQLNYYKVNIFFPTFFGYIVWCDWSYTQKYKARQKAKEQSNQLATS